jgi:hypothetical protein
MKWFKHFSDMHTGRSINNLMDEMGHMGLCFFLLMEMCSEKIDRNDVSRPDAFVFRFHPRKVRQNLRISQTNVRRLLDICRTNGQLEYDISEHEIKIMMPNMLNLLDRDIKKPRYDRAKTAPNTRLDKDKDKEEEEDGAHTAPPAPSLNATKEFNNRFQQEALKITEYMGSTPVGLALKRHSGKIFERFQTLENFKQFIIDSEARYDKTKKDQSLEGFLTMVIKCEIGAIVTNAK